MFNADTYVSIVLSSHHMSIDSIHKPNRHHKQLTAFLFTSTPSFLKVYHNTHNISAPHVYLPSPLSYTYLQNTPLPLPNLPNRQLHRALPPQFRLLQINILELRNLRNEPLDAVDTREDILEGPGWVVCEGGPVWLYVERRRHCIVEGVEGMERVKGWEWRG